MSPNPFLLAADDPDGLLTLLSTNPAVATQQDETGYSLLHAAASYNHLDLLSALLTTYSVSPTILDGDGETALYVCETPEAAEILVSAGCPVAHRNDEGKTARERILEDGDFVEVAEWLSKKEESLTGAEILQGAGVLANDGSALEPPEGIKVKVGEVSEEDLGEADPAIKAYIERLSQRPDFDTPEVQAEVREVVRKLLAGEDVSDIIEAPSSSS